MKVSLIRIHIYLEPQHRDEQTLVVVKQWRESISLVWKEWILCSLIDLLNSEPANLNPILLFISGRTTIDWRSLPWKGRLSNPIEVSYSFDLIHHIWSPITVMNNPLLVEKRWRELISLVWNTSPFNDRNLLFETTIFTNQSILLYYRINV